MVGVKFRRAKSLRWLAKRSPPVITVTLCKVTANAPDVATQTFNIWATLIYIWQMPNITTSELLTLLLSSAVISALVSALLNGVFSRLAKRDEYKNAYFTKVLDRRMRAYEAVEELIVSLKTTLVDKDDNSRPYHVLFSGAGIRPNVYRQIHDISLLSIWLSDELFRTTQELSNLVYADANKEHLIEFGKRNYRELAKLREKMERVLMQDMRVLHDVPAFLGIKRADASFIPLPTHEHEKSND